MYVYFVLAIISKKSLSELLKSLRDRANLYYSMGINFVE